MSTSENETSGMIDSLAKLESTPQGKYDRWSEEITAAEKELKKFHESARKVVKRYIDERDTVESDQKWFNIFNTNVGIIEASLYAQLPTADVSRKFIDMNDDIARVASNILQRCIQQDMREPNCDFDQVMRQCVSDRLIPGLATAWLRLEAETAPNPENPELEIVTHQESCIDYVYWEDFVYSPCRVWAERRWVARKVYMTRDQAIKRFGEEKGKELPLVSKAGTGAADNMTSANMVMKRALVYEIWDRDNREVIWYSKGMTDLLDVRKDPLKLRSGRFEPCPKPLFANITTSNCVPKPDFAMIQDQYTELDDVNNRISLLIVACKVVGVYDRSADGIQRMLTDGYDNVLIPVDNWAMFAEKGGVKGQVDWLPLDVVVQALDKLNNHREAIKGQIYELTGISDIVRGSSKASETLGAQELKSKFASIRIQRLQDEVTRFAEDILQIKADLLTGHFLPEQLMKMANVTNMTPEDQQLAPMAMQLLKGDEEDMEWRVTIQSDAMAVIDYAAQKRERSEFMTAVATFLQSASTVGQGSPQLIPLMLKLLQFGVAGFRVSKDIEGIFDKYVSEFEKEIEMQKAAPPKPSPEEEKMKMEMQIKQADQQMKQQGQQADLQLKQVSAQTTMQQDQLRFQQDMEQSQAEFTLKMQQLQQEFALKMHMEEMKAEIEREKVMSDLAIKQQQATQQAEITAESHENEMNNAVEGEENGD